MPSDIERVEWDLDGDGVYERDTGTALKTDARYPTIGKRTVRVRVTRTGGRVDVAEHAYEVRHKPGSDPVGVSISDGAAYTSRPWVRLDLNWPAYATDVLVSNDGGFRRAKRFPVASAIDWQLASSGAERLPKTVYVRFLVPGPNGATDAFQDARTYTDGIILDETVPTVTEATVEGGAAKASKPRRSRTVSISARDNLSGPAVRPDHGEPEEARQGAALREEAARQENGASAIPVCGLRLRGLGAGPRPGGQRLGVSSGARALSLPSAGPRAGVDTVR